MLVYLFTGMTVFTVWSVHSLYEFFHLSSMDVPLSHQMRAQGKLNLKHGHAPTQK